jgi:GntR family transcriptional regulator
LLDRIVLDRSSPVPLYHQLERAIRGYLAEVRPGPGTPLPTEEKLVRRLGVSRSTVRQALGRLQQDGLVDRRPARGTCVAEAPYAETFRWLDSFVLALLEEGRDVHTAFEPVRHGVRPPTIVVDGLGLDEDEPCHEVRRVTFVDGTPQNHARTFVRARVVPDLVDDDLDERGPAQSLYFALRSRHGVELESVDVFVEPHALDDDEAARLDREPETPALRRTRIVHARGRVPLLVDRAVFVHGFRLTMPEFAISSHTPHGGPA